MVFLPLILINNSSNPPSGNLLPYHSGLKAIQNPQGKSKKTQRKPLNASSSLSELVMLLRSLSNSKPCWRREGGSRNVKQAPATTRSRRRVFACPAYPNGCGTKEDTSGSVIEIDGKRISPSKRWRRVLL